jgi:ParB-like chromosome segregation protein Spo0J
MIEIDRIEVEGRLRLSTNEDVDLMAESMTDRGQLEPIILRHFENRACLVLVAGYTRYLAAQKLGWKEVLCAVRTMSDAEAVLVEIDENLIRAELTPADRALFTHRRKEVYEQLHPDTKRGGDRKSAKAKGKKSNSHGESLIDLPTAPSFVDDTAKKSGRSRATVAREARRGKKIGAKNLAKIKGTSLDKEGELDALSTKTPEEQAPIIEEAMRAAKEGKGEKISARAKNGKKPGNKESEDKVYGPDRELWNEMRKALRLLASGSPPSDEMARIALRCGEDNESIQALLDGTMQSLTEFRTAWFKQRVQHARDTAETIEPVESRAGSPVDEQPTQSEAVQ